MTEDQVLNALHVLDELGMLGLVRPTGNYYQIHCPNREGHNGGEDKKPSCGVLLRDEIRDGRTLRAGWCNCFACGYHKMLPAVVTDILKYKNINRSGLDWLKENIPGFVEDNLDFDYLIPQDISEEVVNKYAINYIQTNSSVLDNEYISEQELASYRLTVPYMYERKLTDEIIEKYDVGFDANFRPAGRKEPVPCITFPIHDLEGNTLGFCRRSIKGKHFYMDAAKSKSIYGMYELPDKVNSLVVTESCFNCLTAVRYGYNAVALLGTGTQSEIDELKWIGAKEIVLCLDNDAAGQRGAKKLKKALSSVGIIRVMTIPPKQDPESGELIPRDVNDISKEEFDLYYSQRF